MHSTIRATGLNICQYHTEPELQITMLTQNIANQRTNPDTSPPFPTEPRERKRKAKDPIPFDGKGSPTERQEKFEIWETKIQGDFKRDEECFKTMKDEILDMSDMR